MATSLGGGTQSYVGGLSSNSDGTGHIQMYNSNAGSLSDFRFSVLNDTRDQYLSFAGTSNAYSTNLFGSARNTSMYIFSNSLGGTPRNLTIGTVHSRDLIFGTNNAEVMRLTSAGNVGIGTSSPNSKLEVSGSFATKYTATATGITLNATHCVVNVTATGQTITLPTASGITGRQYTIKLTASGSCTVDGNGSETIDGATTYSLASQYKYVTIVSDGSNWIITANN